MVAYQGEKMSKSLGNLVLVSRLVADGVDPRAIRLAVLAEHYRSDWEWTDAHLTTAVERLGRWRSWASTAVGDDTRVLERLRAVLGEDLDTPGALALIDAEVAAGARPSEVIVDALDALLGIRL